MDYLQHIPWPRALGGFCASACAFIVQARLSTCTRRSILMHLQGFLVFRFHRLSVLHCGGCPRRLISVWQLSQSRYHRDLMRYDAFYSLSCFPSLHVLDVNVDVVCIGTCHIHKLPNTAPKPRETRIGGYLVRRPAPMGTHCSRPSQSVTVLGYVNILVSLMP